MMDADKATRISELDAEIRRALAAAGVVKIDEETRIPYPLVRLIVEVMLLRLTAEHFAIQRIESYRDRVKEGA